MTVLTQHRPDDTGEIPRGEHTQVIRTRPDLAPPPAPPADGPTTRLWPRGLRRAAAEPTLARGLIEAPAAPTGAELTVAARSGCRTVEPNDDDFLTEPPTKPTEPSPPLPDPPPAPQPKPADDQLRYMPPAPRTLRDRLTYKGRHRVGCAR